MSVSELSRAWTSLWRRLGAGGDPDRVYADLLARYSEPGRAYHTLSHVEHCLKELSGVPEPAADADALEFALWLHDAVYDTRAKDNEAQSAALAHQVARSAGLADAFGGQVTRLILATRHTAPPAAAGERTMVDIDLAILGQSSARFDEYERQIREEYSWVAEDAFAQGRGAFVASMLARPAIYSTPHFLGKYEARARENLRRSLVRLGAR